MNPANHMYICISPVERKVSGGCYLSLYIPFSNSRKSTRTSVDLLPVKWNSYLKQAVAWDRSAISEIQLVIQAVRQLLSLRNFTFGPKEDKATFEY